MTVFQSLPIDGIIVVTSPQELVEMIVGKAMKMASMMNVPVVGLVENMSYFECPDCGKKHEIFGKSRIEEMGRRFGVENIARCPIVSEVAEKVDNGEVEDVNVDWLSPIYKSL